MREVELKFRVSPHFVVPDEVAGPGEPERQRLVAVYYDTVDLRLARAGITLRRREGGSDDGWHLKLPVRGEDATVRDEIQLPLDGKPEAPGPLRDLVTAYARDGVLAPVATLVTERAVRLVAGEDGATLAEVVDDVVSVLDGDRVTEVFREVEVEDRGGGMPLLRATARLLRRAGAVTGEPMPKVVRALGPRAVQPSDPPEPVDPTAGDPARLAVEALLRRQVRALLAEDLRARQDGEDAVHQMRVACRRMRTGLQTFRPLVDEDWAESLRVELGWLAGALGAARDSEVLLARLTGSLASLGEDAVLGDAGTRLARQLGTDVEAGREQARVALHDERYVRLLDRLVDAAWIPRTTALGERTAGAVLPSLVAHAWGRLERRASAMRRTGAADEVFHATRIAAKRVRYAADACAPVLGPPARRLSTQATKMQDALGEHQDAVMAGALLRELATAPRQSPGAAFTFGALYGQERAAAVAARRAARELWSSQVRRAGRRWREHG